MSVQSPIRLPVSRLLPGSRHTEIKNILPIMLKTSIIISKNINDLQCLVAKPAQVGRALYTRLAENCGLDLKVIEGKTYDCMNAADFCMVASGTATLESAISGTPLIVLYKTSLFTYLLAKTLVKIPNIGMVNIVAEKKIVPEFIQSEAKPERIAREMERILTDEGEYERIKNDLTRVRDKLGEKGAYHRGAQIVNQMLSQVFL